jgi:ligand-binding sensor domain-containing protein/signal transduction histidine kinase
MGNQTISKRGPLAVCLFLLLFCLCELLIGRNENIRFDYINVAHGLPQSSVFCILKDSKGFMWFGTQDGLNRYDGRSITPYVDSNVKVENGKFGNVINDIAEDSGGKIWVGTDKGLVRFDPTFAKFCGVDDWQFPTEITTICLGKNSQKNLLWVGAANEVIIVDPKEIKWIDSLKMDHKVTTICCGKNEDLWVGTEYGLVKIDRNNRKILKSYKLPRSESQTVLSIYQDSNSDIWCGTDDGILVKYREAGEGSFLFQHKNDYGLGINAIAEDDKGNLWVGFNGDGITIYPIKEKKPAQKILSKLHIPRSLKDNYVLSILKDDRETIWVGTHSGGVNKYNPRKEKFTTYYCTSGDRESIKGNSIFSIYGDKGGIIWIGTYDGELNKFDPDNKIFEPVKNDVFIRQSILCIRGDGKGDLWFGTINGGLFHCLDKNRGKFEKITNNEVLGRKSIRVIEKDQDGQHLWIGTAAKGIVKFDPRTKEFSDSFSTNNGLTDNNIYSIFPDDQNKNIIWVGTSKNLERVNKKTKEVTPIKYSEDIRIFHIISDPKNKNILWFGTDTEGLCKFDKNNNEIEPKKNENKPDNIVYGTLVDEKGNFWFSTNSGIAEFNPKTEKVERTFDVNDGLQENEFNHGATWKNQKTGMMYFGGIQGLTEFLPANIVTNDKIPPIHFTKLKIRNNEIKVKESVEGKTILSSSLPETETIELNYRQQPFSLEFSALDYNVPKRIKYKGELSDLKGNKLKFWDFETNNYKSFDRLAPGEYRFSVWGSNSDRYFKENYQQNQKSAKIKIIIKRHWLTIWGSFILTVIVIFICSFGIYKFFQIRTKKRIEKLEMIEEAIKDVSVQEKTKDVVILILDNVVDSFGFDYGVISIVDFLNSRVETILNKIKKPNLIHPNKLKVNFKCRLNETNILTEVIKERKTIEIIGKKVKKGMRLNTKNFDEYRQEDLIRIFVPIVLHAKGKDILAGEANMVFGVVEAGFHRSTRTNISKEMKIILELFLNYCSSLFYRALKHSEKQIVAELLNKSSKHEHHEDFLKSVLKNSVNLIGGNKGSISFFSLNDCKINIIDTPILYNYSKGDVDLIKKRIPASKKCGIVSHAAEINHYYYSNNVKKDEYYIEEFEDVNSELAVPMRYSGRVIGVVSIYSTQEGFFDERKANIIQIISDEAAKIFQQKKINQTIKNLVIPFHFFVGIEKIYELIIDNIRNYFIADFVSIWEKTEEKEVKYKLINAFPILKEKYDIFGLSSLHQEIIASNKREIQLINFNESNQTSSCFYEFAKAENLRAMILVPIIVDQQVHGFINIFSKRELLPLLTEDKTFLNLISTKGAISAQYEKLISSFMDISNSLPSENIDRILKNITENASKVLYADPVILFRYDPDEDNLEITISGSLFNSESGDMINIDTEERKRTHLALNIIRKGSVWFEDINKYRKYIKKVKKEKKGNIVEKDFWSRERIKSSVGIRLVQNNKPIGVMFFNYRTEQRFDKDTRRFIEAFSSLASSAIVNAKYLDLIESQKQALEQQAQQLKGQTDQLLTQKENLEFKYEEIHRKMTEMLPRATRTSFYLILEGINHDIRNLLIRMRLDLKDIKDNSDRLHKKERNTIDDRIKDIEINSKKVSNLLKLFDFKKRGKQEVKINELIVELKFFFKTKESESIRFNTDGLNDSLPTIRCHKAELSMIIYNLLSNAVYAIGEKDHSRGEIKVKTDFRNDEYFIIVEDNGIGIDKNDIPKIFEAGFSKKEGGLGIGLYFVDEILRESFYGTIECESQYGYWTRFIIKIPKSINYKED